MTDKSDRDDLKSWLRRGDPAAAGDRPPDDEFRWMRRRILATTPAAPRLRLVPLAALTGAVALGALLLLRPTPPAAPQERATPVRSTTPTSSDTAPRQIQFTTDGGTRIVWTLDPDFEL